MKKLLPKSLGRRLDIGVLRTLGLAALVLGLAALGFGQTTTLTILHTNDMHSAVLPFGTMFDATGIPGRAVGDAAYGGIARIAGLIQKLRAADGNVLALDAGDVFVGSFEFNKYLGYPELKIMENLYDARALGNHEFDLGLDNLALILGGQIAGGPPVTLKELCANVDLEGTNVEPFVQRAITKMVGGIKVGLFGLVTEESQNYSQEVVDRLSGNVINVAETTAELLHNQGCQVVICISHLGFVIDAAYLSGVNYIDIIVGGHSHTILPQPVIQDGKIIVQAGDYGRYLGELTVTLDNGVVGLASYTLHPINSKVKEDPQVRAQVNVLREGVVRDPRFGPVYSRLIAYVPEKIVKDWPADSPNRDSALGNLVTDAFKSGVANEGLYPVDLALDVLGYLAADLLAGQAAGNDILRVVPYGYDLESGLGFKLVVVPLPGYVLLGGLEYAAGLVTMTTDFGVQASGLTYTYNSSKTSGRVDTSSVKINGQPINPEAIYYVVMSDRVFGFLNGLTGNQLLSLPTGLFEYTALRDYMKSLKTVTYFSEGRIKDTATQ